LKLTKKRIAELDQAMVEACANDKSHTKRIIEGLD